MNTLSIVVSSTRPGRIGPKVAAWVAASLGDQWDVRIQDLAEIDLPFFDEEAMPKTGVRTLPHSIDWAERIDGSDAVIVLTPQYNRSFPAPIKNAIDYLFAEWNDKPVAIVGYGWNGGADARADLAKVLTHVKADVVGTMGLTFPSDLSTDGILTVPAERDAELRALSDKLAELTDRVADDLEADAA